jgi:hypothetical protein
MAFDCIKTYLENLDPLVVKLRIGNTIGAISIAGFTSLISGAAFHVDKKIGPLCAGICIPGGIALVNLAVMAYRACTQGTLETPIGECSEALQKNGTTAVVLSVVGSTLELLCQNLEMGVAATLTVSRVVPSLIPPFLAVTGFYEPIMSSAEMAARVEMHRTPAGRELPDQGQNYVAMP